jgi:hypothetical protein
MTTPSDTFLRFAAECERMAKIARDHESKAAWRRMAEQWIQNAKSFERKDLAAQPQHRQQT